MFAREQIDDKMIEEHNPIQAELVEEFLPLITGLADAHFGA